ncbi:MAG: enoyl-CoA hydratase/isomerase family protein [Bacteroidetes bacterium]|nr:enoyl-CoA hydratase/isomerase family protein [Bacteroidota bacterium]
MAVVKSEILNGVCKITLNRPEKYNSFNREMALLLQQALGEASSNKAIRAVLITAEGKAFCAGQDLSETTNGTGLSIERIVREHYNPIILAIRQIEKPVVCAVNGIAAGAGANIALACDIVIAATSASFVQAFSKIGLIPDSGGTFFLPRLVGFQRASALMMLGDNVTATQALQMGMVYKVVEDPKLNEEGMIFASNLANMPTKGIGLTKRLLNESLFNSLEKQLEAEGKMQVEAAASHDFGEGVKAFLEKRKPIFKGE